MINDLFKNITEIVDEQKSNVIVLNISMPIFGRKIKNKEYQEQILERIIKVSNICTVCIPTFTFLGRDERKFHKVYTNNTWTAKRRVYGSYKTKQTYVG